MVLNFKSNKNLIAIKTSNNFGDQIIHVVDLSKDADQDQKKHYPFIAGRIIWTNIEQEGNHIKFDENTIKNLIFS